jgi:16S rRNA (guanine966-N2)-methyltransferase
MRVISGEFGGRRLVAPAGTTTRPTTDKVRQAVFNSLGSMGVIEGAVVADLYAGSGALGIEALSRGAERCVFVERDRAALHALRENIAALDLADRATVHATDWRVRMDSPKSPPNASPTHRRYWTGTGSFSPYFSRISSSPASSASVPAVTRAGSPGIMRTPVKTTRLITKSVTIEMKTRRTRNSTTNALPGRHLTVGAHA